jgi:hypothetical protein
VVNRLRDLSNLVEKCAFRLLLKRNADELYGVVLAALNNRRRLVAARRLIPEIRQKYQESGFTRTEEYLSRCAASCAGKT